MTPIAIEFEDDTPPPVVNGHTVPDHEEGLIGCVFVDGRVLDLCDGISLHNPKYRAIFRAQQKLHSEGQPTDPDLVASELAHATEFSDRSLIPTITELSRATSTTAQAPYFIKKARDAQLRRTLVSRANLILEKAKNPGISSEEIYSLATETLDTSTKAPAPLRTPASFTVPPDNDPNTILGNRFLNRGDGAILVGTSGMGKSSMSIQMAYLAALGRDIFGIKTHRPRRILLVQSEDSDGDVAEIRVSIEHALQLSEDEIATCNANIRIVSERVLRGAKFTNALRILIAAFKPDLVFLNPLQAFMDGDVTEARDLGQFLRERLNALNEPPTFAYVIVHHTTKPSTGKDKGERQWHEVMYDMAGGAEIINWARAVMSLRAAETEGDFNLVLAKRGRRAGVVQRTGEGMSARDEVVTKIPLKHASGFVPNIPGRTKPLPLIFWESREPDVVKVEKENHGGRPPKFNFSDFRSVFPQKSDPGLDLNKLHNVCITNKPIGKTTLHEALLRWEREGIVDVLRPAGAPMRYRMNV